MIARETMVRVLFGTRRRRRSTALALATTALVVTFVTSYVPPLRGVVRGPDGSPAANAYLVYEYEGSIALPTPHPSHASVHRAAGITTTDAEGRFVIPGRLLLFCPPMELHLRTVYSPQLHSSRTAAGSRTGVLFSRLSPLPRHLVGCLSHADFAGKDYELVLSDAGHDPLGRLWSMDALQRATLLGTCTADLGGADRHTIARVLIEEYRSFVQLYGGSAANRSNPFGAWSYPRGQWSYEPYALNQIHWLEAELAR
ncbi:MAG TPA: hypothetical protein VFZ65_19075 [Planctomycetota bacterium]|nr:hypothetical protein [Planctomycetota bacterium]